MKPDAVRSREEPGQLTVLTERAKKLIKIPTFENNITNTNIRN